jgi:hypothetical protein
VIVLINGGPALDRFGPTGYVGRLVSPRAGNLARPGERWAADNDRLKAWDEGRFLKMLRRLESWDRSLCLFVAAPDFVTMTPNGPVGDARKTLDLFEDWRGEIVGRGFPVALVGQDGAEGLDLDWRAIDALFLGGSTAWKLSAAAEGLAREAKRRGKWVHMGRVNSQKRLRHAYEAGCDSVDGTGYSMFPDKYLKREIPYLARLHRYGILF